MIFFQSKKQKQIQKKEKLSSSIRARLYSKIHKFQGGKMNEESFTVDDVINKFGEKPKCYLTGVEIDIYQTTTYHFDHIVPVSKGGDNSINNLGICTKMANMAKTNMTYDEFVELCKKVVEQHSLSTNKS